MYVFPVLTAVLSFSGVGSCHNGLDTAFSRLPYGLKHLISR